MTNSTTASTATSPWSRWGWLMGAVWLVFLYYPGRALTLSAADQAWVVVGWIGLIAFAFSYVSGFVFGMRRRWRSPTRLVIIIFFVAVACAAFTIPAIAWDATGFLPFLMAYAAYSIGTAWHWWSVGVSFVVLTVATIVALNTGEQPLWVLIGIVAMMAIVNSINTWLISRSVVADELRMSLATSEEREFIARDVHDLLGHSLTVVKLKAELASRLIDQDPDAARAELEEISRIAGEAIAGVRSTVTGLRTHSLEEQLRFSHTALETVGISVRVNGSPSSLSPAQALSAGWILREATTNVLRHAEARNVTITFKPGMLVIEDDGVGVRATSKSKASVNGIASNSELSNGLRGMTERAATAGAVLSVDVVRPEHNRNEGTRVSVVW